MDTRVEKGYVKYAWIIFFAYGLLSVIAALRILPGRPPDPPSPEGFTGLTLAEMDARLPGVLGYISSISTQLGNFMLALGVLIMGVAAVPFRKGEKWAWYAFWIFPINLVIQLVNSRGGHLWQLDLAFIFIVLAGLFLPFRKFFPRERVTP